jgi:hypothetical protein
MISETQDQYERGAACLYQKLRVVTLTASYYLIELQQSIILLFGKYKIPFHSKQRSIAVMHDISIVQMSVLELPVFHLGRCSVNLWSSSVSGVTFSGKYFIKPVRYDRHE